MRISDWSSDVCSSDLRAGQRMTEERTVLDQRVDAARRAEGLARHRRQVMELKQGLILHERIARELAFKLLAESEIADPPHAQIGRASCRERVCQYVYISVVAVALKKKKKRKKQQNIT